MLGSLRRIVSEYERQVGQACEALPVHRNIAERGREGIHSWQRNTGECDVVRGPNEDDAPGWSALNGAESSRSDLAGIHVTGVRRDERFRRLCRGCGRFRQHC
jgi:hypothetical protein